MRTRKYRGSGIGPWIARTSLITLCSTVMLGCGADDGDGGETLSVVEEPMKSSINISSARGVVWLRRDQGKDSAGNVLEGHCTGSMINQNVIVTAGHCVNGKGWSKYIVEYFDPAVGRKRRITEEWETLSTARLPGYEVVDGVSNPAHDLAIVVRVIPWEGTDTGDYLFIRNNTGVATPLDLTIYGAGYDTFSKTGRGDLEKYTKFADGVSPTTIVTSDPSGNGMGRVCKGDSGGPVNVAYYDGEAMAELPLLLAINSMVGIAETGDVCQGKYMRAHHTRVGPHIEWIESRSGALLGAPGPLRCATVFFQTVPFAPLLGAYRCWN